MTENFNEQGVRFTHVYYQRTYNLQEDDFTLTDGTDEPPESKPKAEFAEASKKKARIPEKFQKRVDKIIDAAIDKALPLFEKRLARIRNHLAGAKSLKAAGDTLADLYGDHSDLGAVMADALHTADRMGVESVQAEIGPHSPRPSGAPENRFRKRSTFLMPRASPSPGSTMPT